MLKPFAENKTGNFIDYVFSYLGLDRHMTSDSIQASELVNLLSSGCQLIDVREPIEYAEEHIEGAKLIPLAQIEMRNGEIDRNQPIVVMCRGGKRGEEAMKKMHAMGITQIRNLDGGVLAWKAAKLPLIKNRKRTLPLMQQVQLIIGTGVLTGAILSLTLHPYWVFLSAFFGAGLMMAGTTGWCGLAILMAKMPWNRIPEEK
jgi:rhodanese-related sulfurtransferase